MDLNILWFILLTVLFSGFFFLEGFDYGVGMLLPFVAKTDNERRAIINTIGPVWDGNEVWMITAGGAMFAAFPHMYATLFSGFYVALVFMLIGLIIRGVAFEFRSKREDPAWRERWDWAIYYGSLLPALLWGVTVANLMRGVAIESDLNYYGGLIPLLNPYSMFGGVVFLGLFLVHGASFLGIKLEGDLKDRVKKLSGKIWIVVVVLAVIFLVWTYFATDILNNPGYDGLIPAILAAVALLAYGWFQRQGKEGLTFICGGLVIILATVMVFSGLFPRLMISTLDPTYSLTIYNASSSPYTLKVITIVAAIFLPLILAYQGWTYWIFRKRLSPDSPDLHY
ncbi:MAG TPA: cytochrome d ubiquinol oxidase subunit II [Chloroflexi bacterium]|nr:cytochrome d ubiquinol oxidase subunit II [Anaerolineales bacterium]RLD03860.1 MAG: cytochrome d ubiquinol oxidase subunit II [Chloroflexota bacterium]HDN05256.1 cytochrome d ubiquinol oxidase subunit II [Chloroflexota bacterium]